MLFNFIVGEGINYDRLFRSPPFTFSSGSISASGSEVIDFHETTTATQKYGSFNKIRIANLNTTSDVAIDLNQNSDRRIIIGAGVTTTIDDEFNLTSVKIVNLDSSNALTSGDIRITVWKDRRKFENVFERMHKRVFKPQFKPSFKATKFDKILDRVI